jgi:hypothetical protein
MDQPVDSFDVRVIERTLGEDVAGEASVDKLAIEESLIVGHV